ncbi:MAG: ribosome biogenesis protein [Asgard group archaeon]|nr:ribosome biogenesis protein [Asgard group archaeon]
MSLHKCLKCGTYTLQESCSKCKEKAVPPAPAKFSIEHSKKYGKYRRELMRRMKQKQESE